MRRRSASDSTFDSAGHLLKTLKNLLLTRARPVLFRRRGGAQLKLELQIAITLFRLGHYGDACSVDSVADLCGVSVGAVIKSTRRVVKVLAGAAPQHFRWPNAQRRAALSAFAEEKYGFQQCIGATDGTTFPLAYQPVLQLWTYLKGSRGTASMGSSLVAGIATSRRSCSTVRGRHLTPLSSPQQSGIAAQISFSLRGSSSWATRGCCIRDM